jgi:hypothetical protein
MSAGSSPAGQVSGGCSALATHGYKSFTRASGCVYLARVPDWGYCGFGQELAGDWAVSAVAEGADLETADHSLPTRAPALAGLTLAQPKPRKLPAAKPEMNRQERVISNAFLAMVALIVAFLATTGLVAWLGA